MVNFINLVDLESEICVAASRKGLDLASVRSIKHVFGFFPRVVDARLDYGVEDPHQFKTIDEVREGLGQIPSQYHIIAVVYYGNHPLNVIELTSSQLQVVPEDIVVHTPNEIGH